MRRPDTICRQLVVLDRTRWSSNGASRLLSPGRADRATNPMRRQPTAFVVALVRRSLCSGDWAIEYILPSSPARSHRLDAERRHKRACPRNICCNVCGFGIGGSFCRSEPADIEGAAIDA